MHTFRRVLGDLYETLRKLYLPTKFPHQELGEIMDIYYISMVNFGMLNSELLMFCNPKFYPKFTPHFIYNIICLNFFTFNTLQSAFQKQNATNSSFSNKMPQSIESKSMDRLIKTPIVNSQLIKWVTDVINQINYCMFCRMLHPKIELFVLQKIIFDLWFSTDYVSIFLAILINREVQISVGTLPVTQFSLP